MAHRIHEIFTQMRYAGHIRGGVRIGLLRRIIHQILPFDIVLGLLTQSTQVIFKTAQPMVSIPLSELHFLVYFLQLERSPQSVSKRATTREDMLAVLTYSQGSSVAL